MPALHRAVALAQVDRVAVPIRKSPPLPLKSIFSSAAPPAISKTPAGPIDISPTALPAASGPESSSVPDKKIVPAPRVKLPVSSVSDAWMVSSGSAPV